MGGEITLNPNEHIALFIEQMGLLGQRKKKICDKNKTNQQDISNILGPALYDSKSVSSRQIKTQQGC